MKRPKLKGPEIKVPDLKAPALLADLYYDLRDRRLLPLIALVLVAIVAVPFLMGSDPESVPALPAGSAALETAPGKTSKLTVVEATPGLRDYRKRLRGRAPSDPFKQLYAESPSEGGSASESGSAVGGGSSPGSVSAEGEEGSEVVEPAPSTGGSGGGSSGSVDPDDPGLHFFAYRPDIRFGVAGSNQLTSYESLPLGRVLPSKNPVVAFIGVSEDGKRVAFDVSNEVAMVRGPGHCIGGNQSCSLLTLRAGQAADIVTGKPNRNFRLQVVRINFIEVERPKAASSSSAAGHPWSFDLAVVGQFQTKR